MVKRKVLKGKVRKSGEAKGRIIKAGLDVDGFVNLEKGECFDGVYTGLQNGKYGKVPTLIHNKKTWGFPTHNILLQLFRDIKIGDNIEVRCLGKVKADSGNSYYDYELVILDEPEEDDSPF